MHLTEYPLQIGNGHKGPFPPSNSDTGTIHRSTFLIFKPFLSILNTLLSLFRKQLPTMSGNAKATNGSVIVTAGTILPFASDKTTSLQGWRLCDGSSLAAADFPDLFAVISNANGGNASKGQGTFNIPDLRARFLRGASATNAVGTVLPSTT